MRPTRVVVNRMRPTLRWSEKDVAGMVSGFSRLAGLHFLPEDRDTVDRMLVAGRTLPEVGDSALGRAVGCPRRRDGPPAAGPGAPPSAGGRQAANSR